jgi:hypothetical protein
MGTLRENQFTFLIISRSVSLRMKIVSEKSCRETRNTHFLSSNFFRKWCLFWDNVEKYCRAELATDDNMVHAHCCWIHSQQWLHECVVRTLPVLQILEYWTSFLSISLHIRGPHEATVVGRNYTSFSSSHFKIIRLTAWYIKHFIIQLMHTTWKRRVIKTY